MSEITLADGIIQFLVPIMGEAPARRLVLLYCAKANKQPADFNQDDLAHLGEFLLTNLRMFVGTERARSVMERLANSRMTSVNG